MRWFWAAPVLGILWLGTCLVSTADEAEGREGQAVVVLKPARVYDGTGRAPTKGGSSSFAGRRSMPLGQRTRSRCRPAPT